MDTVDQLHATEDRVGYLSHHVKRIAELAKDFATPKIIQSELDRLAAEVEGGWCRCDGVECDDDTCGCSCHDGQVWEGTISEGGWVAGHERSGSDQQREQTS